MPKKTRAAGAPPLITLSFTGDMELRKRLQAVAYRKDRTVSDVLRDLVGPALTREERKLQRETQPTSPSAA